MEEQIKNKTLGFIIRTIFLVVMIAIGSFLLSSKNEVTEITFTSTYGGTLAFSFIGSYLVYLSLHTLIDKDKFIFKLLKLIFFYGGLLLSIILIAYPLISGGTDVFYQLNYIYMQNNTVNVVITSLVFGSPVFTFLCIDKDLSINKSRIKKTKEAIKRPGLKMSIHPIYNFIFALFVGAVFSIVYLLMLSIGGNISAEQFNLISYLYFVLNAALLIIVLVKVIIPFPFKEDAKEIEVEKK